MAVQDAMSSMARALKDLQLRWGEVSGGWKDGRAADFQAKYLDLWERDFRTSMSQVDSMSTYLEQVRRDCE